MPSNLWLRLYRAALHNPKIVSLTDRQHRAWHNCLLIADDSGVLPSLRDIAVHLRMTLQDAEAVICDLVEARLIDPVISTDGARVFHMHDWSTHQYQSDNSSDRVRRCREKKKSNKSSAQRDCNVSSPLQSRHQTSESESESEKKKFFSCVSGGAPTAADVPAQELGSNRFAKPKKGDLDPLVRRAEGLGLDVEDLIATTDRARPGNRPAYFTTLCVNRLQGRLPGLDPQVLRDALWGREAQYGAVCQLLLEPLP